MVPEDPPLTCKEDNFVPVGDEYLRFDESDKNKGGNGMASWYRLVMYTIEKDAQKITIMEKITDEDDPLCCPITQEIMKNPVMASDGHTYEEHAIKAWYAIDPTSPMTREKLMPIFTKNFALMKAIHMYHQMKKGAEGLFK